MAEAGELTAELRWWWSGDPAPALLAWFEAGSPGEAEERVDVYAPTGSDALGIKRRGGASGIEVKALAARLAADLPGGMAELWLKTSAPDVGLPAGPQVEVAKRRRLRSFAVVEGEASEGAPPDRWAECRLELGSARLGGGPPWGTLCFEARADLADPLVALMATLALTGPPPLPEEAFAASYPGWLARLARI